MKRHNYASRAFERRLDALADRFPAPHLRGPLTAVVGATLAVAITATIELQRAGALDNAVAASSPRAAESVRVTAQVAVLEAEVGRLAQIEAALAELRRAAAQRVNDLALLGNHLPERTWLTAVRTGRDGSWSIEGRSTRLIEIGATLSGLESLDAAAPVRLLSIAPGNDRSRAFRFALAWDRRP